MTTNPILSLPTEIPTLSEQCIVSKQAMKIFDISKCQVQTPSVLFTT
jgi:hypothetical protein